MYTSITASSDYPNRDTQCDSMRSHIDRILVSLELCNSKGYATLCKESLRRRGHREMPGLKNEQRTSSKCLGMVRIP